MATILLGPPNSPPNRILPHNLRHPLQTRPNPKYILTIFNPKSSSFTLCELDCIIIDLEFFGFGMEDYLFALEMLYEMYWGIDV